MGPSVMGILACSSFKMQVPPDSQLQTPNALGLPELRIFPESEKEHNSSLHPVPGNSRKTSIEPRGEVFCSTISMPKISL